MGDKTDYKTMKIHVAAGVLSVGTYNYRNMNLGLCRILIPIITGSIVPFAKLLINDAAWDAVTLTLYKDFMQNAVFSPAGVTNVGWAPSFAHKNALAYLSTPILKGWGSGDLKSVAGGAGWRLSTHELLDILHDVRRKNTIISSARAQSMLDKGYGIDQITNTPIGNLYNKNGKWRNNDRTEQCVIFFMPDKIEATVFVNSPIGIDDQSLRNIVSDAYINSLVVPP